MSVKSELKNLIASLGGTVTQKSIPGLIGDVSIALGGDGTGKTVAEQIKNIADAKWDANPLSKLVVDADIADSVDLLGKKASDLQENIVITDTVITGTSKYVTGYTGFSGKASERKGNYLALHFGVTDLVIGTSVTVKVNGVTLDPDGLHIMRFKDDGPSKGIFIVEVIKDGYPTFTKEFDVKKVIKQQPTT